MKRMILAVIAVAACSVEASVMYRGRLVNAENPDAGQLVSSGSKKMTFRFYDDLGLQQGEPLVREVPLETNGMFTVLLDSPELTEAIRAGRATQVGLTVGDAANEIRPLRKLLPTARAAQADAAAGLSRGAKVGKMTAACVEAGRMAVGVNLTVGGAIKPVTKGMKLDQTSYTVRMEAGSKLRMKDGTLAVLGEPILLSPDLAKGCRPVGAGDTTMGPGGTAIVAPADGVATICCVETLKTSEVNSSDGRQGAYYATAYAPCCSVVRFYEKGRVISAPAGWSWQPTNKWNEEKRFIVRFHPFVGMNH